MIRIRTVAFVKARKLLTALLLTWLAASSPVLATSFDQLDGNPNLRSESALVIDAKGNLIYGKDVDAVRPIASITKLMTAMEILDALNDTKQNRERRISLLVNQYDVFDMIWKASKEVYPHQLFPESHIGAACHPLPPSPPSQVRSMPRIIFNDTAATPRPTPI